MDLANRLDHVVSAAQGLLTYSDEVNADYLLRIVPSLEVSMFSLNEHMQRLKAGLDSLEEWLGNRVDMRSAHKNR